jgi:hypothetical protein
LFPGTGDRHRKEQHDMNVLTDILAGLAHFLGWLI